MAATIGLLLFAIAVEGSSDCPTPAAVEERLRALAPARGGEVARLASEESGLRVTLQRADGTEAGSRVVAGQHGCDELAEAVAVMIAAWQEAPPAPLPPPPPPAPPVVATVPQPPQPPAVRRWEIGAGVGAGLADSVAPSALVMASVGGRVGAGLRTVVSGGRDTTLPAGRAHWRRALLAVGPHLRQFWPRLFGEVHLGAGVGWLTIDGQGFAQDQRHDDLVGVLEGGLRLAWNRGGARPWLELGAAFWPVRSVVYQLPDQRSAALPRLELLATLGLSFAR